MMIKIKEQIIIRDSKRLGWQFILPFNSRYTVDQEERRENNGIFERIRRSYTFSE